MVVEFEARKLESPSPNHSITSLIYEPTSLSLALAHPDSSFSLYPSFSPFSLSSPSPQTLVSPSCSSACFVSLNPNPNSQNFPDCPSVVFLTAGPGSGASRVVLRFHVLGKDGKFGRAHVVCAQNGVTFDVNLSAVVVDVSHGLRVSVFGSVNYFALHSASARQVWVFGVKLGTDGDGAGLRLVKCAVIDCRLPVSSVGIGFGYLVLGELNGVRVFPLQALVKGKGSIGSSRRSGVVRGRNLKLRNGVIRNVGESYDFDKSKSKLMANWHAYNVGSEVGSSSNADGSHESVKPRSRKLRQDSGEVGMQFVLFSDSIVEELKSGASGYKTTKAISIQALSQQKFLILDSNGHVHLLQMSKSGSVQMRQLTGIIQAQQLAAFPDKSANAQTIWLSDGHNSVHLLVMPGADKPDTESDMSFSEGMIVQSSVTEAIFTSESIQDMISLAGNTVLLLGQDSLYAYAIS